MCTLLVLLYNLCCIDFQKLEQRGLAHVVINFVMVLLVVDIVYVAVAIVVVGVAEAAQVKELIVAVALIERAVDSIADIELPVQDFEAEAAAIVAIVIAAVGFAATAMLQE